MLLYICLLTVTLACADTDRAICDNIAHQYACRNVCNCSTIPGYPCAHICIGCIIKYSNPYYAKICCNCLFPNLHNCTKPKVDCLCDGTSWPCGSFNGNYQCCNGQWISCPVMQHSNHWPVTRCGYCLCGKN